MFKKFMNYRWVRATRNYLRRKKIWFKRLSMRQKIGLIGGSVAAVLILIPLLTYLYFARDIANEERLMNRNQTGVVLLDRHGEEFYRAFNANASDTEAVSFEEMPNHLVEALLASEDRRFYEHNGYSIRGIIGALYGNIVNRDATKFGGSTITQQLAKNALLTNDKNYLRKYQELFLAIAIERHYEKDKILEMYLNSVYFGEGSFGIEHAAQTYFDKPATELSLAESSLLIGILPAPSAWSPITGSLESAKERQEFVLSNMLEIGYIDAAAKEQTIGEELVFVPPEEVTDQIALHFAEMAIEELEKEYGEERVARSGFRVQTTLDLEWQRQAETATREHIAQIQSLGASNGAAVAIDPANGELRVLVGSSDWNNEEFGKVNMATALRQPGSSFKPIYYAEALAQRLITPATIIRDEPTSFGSYEPENFDLRFRGDVTVRNALANSLNIPAVKIMEELGVNESIQVAQKLGLKSIEEGKDYGLSLALGTAEVRLLDLANAYAAFAAGGRQYTPTTIQSIENKYGRTIYEHESQGAQVFDTDASFLISSILADNNARAATFGSSLSIGRPAAVKTGTTEDNRDALTVGYTPSIAVGVWVGNNDNEPMSSIGGSSGAAPIWRAIMTAITNGTDIEQFEPPAGVISSLICWSNGLPAPRAFEGTYTEYFLRGTLPEGQCAPPREDRDEGNQNEDEADAEDETDSRGNNGEPANPQPGEPGNPNEPEPGEDDEDDEGDEGETGGTSGSGNNNTGSGTGGTGNP